ncbi:MAG: Fur family transcriptional regulator [Roseobacter sp.]
MSSNGFNCHDHTVCVETALRRAEDHCTASGLKFTAVRRRALEILLIEHRALGAYDLLAHLAKDGLGSQPPVAYRALDFLVKAELAHKIEGLNAYIACTHSDESHTPAFLVCVSCKSVVETHTSPDFGQLGSFAHDVGFQIRRTVVEAQGLCPNCQ